MGNAETRVDFRKAVIELTSAENNSADEIYNNSWLQTKSAKDLFSLIPATDIRLLRENNPSNLASLCKNLVKNMATSHDKVLPQSDHKKVFILQFLKMTIIFEFLGDKLRTAIDSHHSISI
jgi:hypothetical protein